VWAPIYRSHLYVRAKSHIICAVQVGPVPITPGVSGEPLDCPEELGASENNGERILKLITVDGRELFGVG